MMSKGGKATGAVHDQEELHLMYTICCVVVVCMFVHTYVCLVKYVRILFDVMCYNEYVILSSMIRMSILLLARNSVN